MKSTVISLALLFLPLIFCCAKVPPVKHYDVEGLLTRLSKNDSVRQILLDAEHLYNQLGINQNDISMIAFKVAYLEKKVIDYRIAPFKSKKFYQKKDQLAVVDFTKTSNKKRLIVIDLAATKVIENTLVAVGAANGTARKNLPANPRNDTPCYFSNKNETHCSSLGMMLAIHGLPIGDNKCHTCKYKVKHFCQMGLWGVEAKINDGGNSRGIIMHTTGSGDTSIIKKEHDYEIAYKITGCQCNWILPNGNTKSSVPYAAQCRLEGNPRDKSYGYIGQSWGCLVVPEDDHIEVINTLKDGTLIFCYSDIAAEDYNYFNESPIIKSIVLHFQK